jgi:hypothetical protein
MILFIFFRGKKTDALRDIPVVPTPHTHFSEDDLEYIMASGFQLMEHKTSKTT